MAQVSGSQQEGPGMSGFSLANRHHLEMFVTLLVAMGAACPKCGHGTRVTSKRWAKCKHCGERVQRRKLDDITVVPAGSEP